MYVIRGWGIGLQKGLFLRGLGLGNCTDWLRLSVESSSLSRPGVTPYMLCKEGGLGEGYGSFLIRLSASKSGHFVVVVIHKPHVCGLRSGPSTKIGTFTRFSPLWDSPGYCLGAYMGRAKLAGT
jgi:hypothetical protein